MTEESDISDNNNNDSIIKEKIEERDHFFLKILKSPEISIPILLIGICVISFIIFYVWRYIRIRRQKRLQLEALTTKPSTSQYAGVKASHTIEFVVPTITLKTTEPVFSLTDESDSDFTQFGYSSDYSNRKRNSRIQINEHEISKSLYDNPPPKPEQRTEVNFVLHYSIMRQQLLVTLLSARNLPQKKHNLNPMAKVVLLPEKSTKFVTKVQKNTTNPIFNELFVFQAMRNSLDDRTLKITVYNTDSFSRKSVIGRVLFPLRTADITSQVTTDIMTEDISCLLRNNQPSGELLVSLNYDTSSSTLTLGALKVRNIFDKEVQQIYIKVVLFVKRKRIRSRKTVLRKVESEIDFNDIFHVNVDKKEAINDLMISISIYGKSSSFNNKHLLGRTHLGQSCPSAQGRQHWAEMFTTLDTCVTQWHVFC